jgi:hypothetical protein
VIEKWKRYRDFGRLAQLKNAGRELVGRTIYWTEKRDGSNISFWLNGEGAICVSSHNMEVPTDESLLNCVKATAEFSKIAEILEEHPACIIYCELIRAGLGPTRTEPKHKIPRLILLDIFATESQTYLTYNYVHQVAHKYRFPIVKLLDMTQPSTLEELYETRDGLLKWCKRHRREGVVGKCWYSTDTGYESVFFKEKIDLPNIGRIPKDKPTGPKLPPMPTDKIRSAIDQAREECERAGNDFRNPKYGMPLVATHLNVQAAEHSYAVPGNFFGLYQQFLEGRL